MIKGKKDYWFCLYVYCNPPFENLLVNHILPIIENLLDDDKIKNFFFIRYFEDGPHIRLRINFQNTHFLNTSKREIIQRLLNYLELKDASYQSISAPRILKTKYNPEFERYGGANGIAIAEQIFHFSSVHILKSIKSNSHWSYSKAMYLALSMNYIMISELIIDSNELCDFYQFSFNRWFPRAYYNHRTGIYDNDIKKGKIRTYMDLFNRSKVWILPLLNNLSKGKSMQLPYSVFREQIRSVKLSIDIFKEEMLENSKAKYGLHSIYDSYCHMTNNRLGIRNADESMITFFILQSLLNGKTGKTSKS